MNKKQGVEWESVFKGCIIIFMIAGLIAISGLFIIDYMNSEHNIMQQKNNYCTNLSTNQSVECFLNINLDGCYCCVTTSCFGGICGKISNGACVNFIVNWESVLQKNTNNENSKFPQGIINPAAIESWNKWATSLEEFSPGIFCNPSMMTVATFQTMDVTSNNQTKFLRIKSDIGYVIISLDRLAEKYTALDVHLTCGKRFNALICLYGESNYEKCNSTLFLYNFTANGNSMIFDVDFDKNVIREVV